MGFNKYILNVIVRSVLLAITALLIAFFAIKLNWISTFVFLILLFLLQIILFIRFASKINRDLANFLIHLKEQNTTIKFSSNIDKMFGEITTEFDKINQEFKKIESEKIRKQNLLNLLLKKIGTGILLINKSGEIQIKNRAICQLLGLEQNSSNDEIRKTLKRDFKDLSLIKPGDQKIVNIHQNNITRRVLVSLTEIKEDKISYDLLTFHDIDREITDYELQTWNGLIKVLSHELLNTITPISTAIDTSKDCLMDNSEPKHVENINQKDISDSVKAIKLVDNRISGLKDFIKRFRQFIDMPVPTLLKIDLMELIQSVADSYKKENIVFDIKPDKIEVTGDKELIELVLINILKNAKEANASKIAINSTINNNQLIVEIKDNADGIDQKIISKVFLPFYTTKVNGSGIGLSISRQIMFAHKGNLELISDSTGTTVRLVFNRNLTDLL